MMSFIEEQDDQNNVSNGDRPEEASSGDVSSETNEKASQVTSQIGSLGASEGMSLTETLKNETPKFGASNDDFLTPSSSGKKVKNSTMILGAVFLIGAISLFLAITKFGPSKVSAALTEDEIKVESAIAKLSGSKAAINSKMNDIVDRISSLSKVEQVSVDELRRNPFLISNIKGVDASSVTDNENSGTGLKLWGIMESDGIWSCMINDQIYTPGDSVDKYTVKRIGQELVELAAGDKVLLLRMAK